MRATRDVSANDPKKTTAVQVPFVAICTTDQIVKAHSMGWRVMRNTPRGSESGLVSAPTAVGFGLATEATNNMKAGSITPTAIQPSTAGKIHIGAATEEA